MTTWYICAVSKVVLTGSIRRYLCCRVVGPSLESGVWKTRDEVARLVLAGDEFWTARQGRDGLWYRRAKVEIHITTEPNAAVDDNLENLPTAA